MIGRTALACIALGVALGGVARPVPAATLRVVARTGDAAPEGIGIVADFVGTPAIDAEGRLAYAVLLERTGSVHIGNDFAVLGPASDGGARVVLREGDAAPGAPAGYAFADGQPLLAEGGRVVVRGIARSSAFGDRAAIWRSDVGEPVALWIAETTDFAAEYERDVVSPWAMALNAEGRLLFYGSLRPDETTIYTTQILARTDADDRVEILLRELSTPPVGSPADKVWSGIQQGQWIAMNALGQVAGTGSVRRPPPEGAFEKVLYGPTYGADLAVLARALQPAPGIPGAVFSNREFHAPALNRFGVLAATLWLEPGVGSVTHADDEVLWVTGAGGTVEPRWREGEGVPGVPGARFGSSSGFALGDPLLDDRGDLAFRAFIQVPDGQGGFTDGTALLYGRAHGAVAAKVWSGSAIPGAPGVVRSLDRIAMNERGDVFFTALMDGGIVPEIDPENPWLYTGLFALARGGALQTIALADHLLDLAPGDARRVIDFSFLEGRHVGRESVNARGELAFVASFDDGSDALLVAAVPEPSTAVLLAAGLATLVRIRRRR
jgi:hypothetical protein